MNKKLKQKPKSIKAEITVVYKTCNLMNYEEFIQKYNGNIEKAIKDILNNYSLVEIIENEYVILDIKVHLD